MLLFQPPTAAPAADETTTSPRGTFTIMVQHLEQSREDYTYSATIRFRNTRIPEIRHAFGTFTWPPYIEFSPDEKYILQWQKTGSGESVTYLFRIDVNHHLWKLPQTLDQLAFDILEKHGVTPRDYYHIGIENEAKWIRRPPQLQLTLRGTANDKTHPHLRATFVLNLKTLQLRWLNASPTSAPLSHLPASKQQLSAEPQPPAQ